MTPLTSFDDIYDTYAGAVYRVCLRAVSRKEVAEELTNEVFLALYQGWEKMTPEQLPAWLFTVAKRRTADYWRHHYVEESWVSAQVEEVNCHEPEHPMAELLARCHALKPIHRICVTLRFSHGMSRAEIAKQLSLSELQVKGHLQYALQLLRQHMTSGTQTDRTARTDLAKGGMAHVELDTGI
jgi:RNA polymerase sigma-70 factor (ECF subfamily)